MILRNCDLRTFSDRCKGKKIACYGIGKEFDRIIKSYSDYEWVDNIEFLVDGNVNREGEVIRIKERNFLLMSIQTFQKIAADNVILFIACMAYSEIIKELNRIPQFDNTQCYLFHFMFPLSEGEKIEIKRRKERLIPPTIHYCWFGGKDKPDLYKRCIESWYKYCPDYEIKEWNEDNCDVTETVFTKQAYECGKYGFVPDYFRLKITYENGGIYLDTDVEILKDINELRYNEAFCGLEFPGEAALGLGFGAVKGHPLILRMMERYRAISFVNPDGSLNETGSPVFQSADLMEHGMTYENKLQEVAGMTIYPIEVLSPQNVYTGITGISENTFMWHHFDGSWVSGDRLRRNVERKQESAMIQQMIDVNEGEN